MDWTTQSWESFPIKQQPEYPDSKHLKSVLNQISSYPPLVFAGEVRRLRRKLADVADGKQFILQGGDCAERFQDCTSESVTRKLQILLQMSVVLCYGSRKPIVRIGRIAGQYGKPRSNNTETIDGKEIPVYRGENVNDFESTLESRVPNPDRLLKAYHLSAITLNYIRALTTGGFADLHHPENWNLSFVHHSAHKPRYQEIVSNIRDAIHFMESLGAQDETLGTVDFYTSHEGLILGYESALTKHVEGIHSGFYNLGAHMLWIGDRTRQLDGAHIEFFRGIENPVGLKVGPSADPQEIIEIIEKLNPDNEKGKIVLITRYGAGKVKEHLPKMIEAVQKAQKTVVWSSDPMHGNAIKTEKGVKTRDFGAILSEVQDAFEVHKSQNSYLGGVHFELTGEDVTECIGGSEKIKIEDLDKKYETFCDPRLNYSQSLELAFLVSEMMKAQK